MGQRVAVGRTGQDSDGCLSHRLLSSHAARPHTQTTPPAQRSTNPGQDSNIASVDGGSHPKRAVPPTSHLTVDGKPHGPSVQICGRQPAEGITISGTPRFPVVTRMASAASCSRVRVNAGVGSGRTRPLPDSVRRRSVVVGLLAISVHCLLFLFHRAASWAELTIWSMTLAGGAPARSDTVTKISDVGTMPEAAGPVSTATVSAWNLAFAVEKVKRTW